MTLVPTAPPFQEESMEGKVMGLTPTGWVWKLTNQKKKNFHHSLFIFFWAKEKLHNSQVPGFLKQKANMCGTL